MLALYWRSEQWALNCRLYIIISFLFFFHAIMMPFTRSPFKKKTYEKKTRTEEDSRHLSRSVWCRTRFFYVSSFWDCINTPITSSRTCSTSTERVIGTTGMRKLMAGIYCEIECIQFTVCMRHEGLHGDDRRRRHRRRMMKRKNYIKRKIQHNNKEFE